MKMKQLRELVRESIISLIEVSNVGSPYVAKARKIVEMYAERKVGNVEVLFHRDHRNPAVAIRAEIELHDDETGEPSGEHKTVDFLLEPGLGGRDLQSMSDQLEEVEFNSWPPKSFQSKPPLGDVN